MRGVVLLLATCSVLPRATAAAPFAYIVGSKQTVSVIDTQTNTVVATRTVSDPRLVPFLGGGVVSRDGSRLFVATGANVVGVLSAANQHLLGVLPTGNLTIFLAVAPDGKRIYAVNVNDNTVSVVDTGTGRAVATIPVGKNPNQIDVTPNGTRAYVTNVVDNSVSVIDTAEDAVVATITGIGSPEGIAVSPNGTRAYVSGTNGVSIIDATMNVLIGTITIPLGMPGSVALSPDGRRLYVADTQNGKIFAVDLNQASFVPIAVGSQPFGVAVTPDGRRVYVSNQQSQDVSVVDVPANVVIATIPLGIEQLAAARFIGPAHFCGDGVVDAGEACDDGDKNGTAESCCLDDCSLGTTCTDDDPCTVGDACQAATCVPGDRICLAATTSVAKSGHMIQVRFDPADGVGGGGARVAALGLVPTPAPLAETAIPAVTARDLCGSLTAADLMPVTRCKTRKFGKHARPVRLSVGLNPVGQKLLRKGGSLDVTVQTTLMDRRGRRATLKKVLKLVR